MFWICFPPTDPELLLLEVEKKGTRIQDDFNFAIGSHGVNQGGAINNLVDYLRHLIHNDIEGKVHMIGFFEKMASEERTIEEYTRVYVSMATLTRPSFLDSCNPELKTKIENLVSSLYSFLCGDESSRKAICDPALPESSFAIRGWWMIV